MKEQCLVLFPYTAQNEDELTLQEGQVIKRVDIVVVAVVKVVIVVKVNSIIVILIIRRCY